MVDNERTLDALQNTMFRRYPSFLKYDAEDFCVPTTEPAATAGLVNLPASARRRFEPDKDTVSQIRSDSGKYLGAVSVDISAPTLLTSGHNAMDYDPTGQTYWNVSEMRVFGLQPK